MKARKNSAVFGFSTSAGMACQKALAGDTCEAAGSWGSDGFSSTARMPR